MKRGMWAAVGVLLAFIFTFLAVWQPFSPEDRDQGQVNNYWIVALVIVVVAAVLFGAIVPRVRNGPRAALVLGILALVTTPVAFWSGMPFLFGAGAVMLGLEARRTEDAGVLPTVAGVLGTVSIVVSAVFNVTS
jgi:hypothetical protein